MTNTNHIITLFDNFEEEGAMACWLGQQSYIFKVKGKIIYIDLFLSDKGKRQIPPFFKPEEVTNADYFLGTHRHRDHIDEGIWPALSEASPSATFVVPEFCKESVATDTKISLSRFAGIEDGETVELDEDLKITGVASAHEMLHQDPDTGLYPFMGFVIEVGGLVIYAPGDTCIYDGLVAKLSRWNIDVALLPINGRDAVRYAAGTIGNMTYQEAVDLAGAIRPALTIPGHYDMFAHNAENPYLFTDFLRVKFPDLKFKICQQGKVFIL